ncbi:MAG: cell wall hydrolase [Rhodospirillaceae bacterium]|nr:cell wall hydrolase [Rhodospirillaceae bacterium]
MSLLRNAPAADDSDHPDMALDRMVRDPLYWREQDPEFRSYVDDSFKAVYGNEAAEQDATGRTVSPPPRAGALPPFRPTATEDDTNLSQGVGTGQPNAWRDVYRSQKLLSAAGRYDLDMAKERSGEHSLALSQSIQGYQRDKGETIDGIMLPNGPTVGRLKEALFGVGGDRAVTDRPGNREAFSPPGRIEPVQFVPKEDATGETKPASYPPPSRPTTEQLRYLQGGDMNTVKFELLPRGRYPRDPHGLDDPRHPYDPAKPVGPRKPIYLENKDIELIARLVEAEAGNHGELGKQGVLFVILNSMAMGKPFGGPTAVGAMNYPNRFEPVRLAGGNAHNLRAVTKEKIARIKQWIDQIRSGELTDPTDGALYFLNRRIAGQRGTDFSEDAEPLMVVGPPGARHHFYNRYEGKAIQYVPPYRVEYGKRPLERRQR